MDAGFSTVESRLGFCPAAIQAEEGTDMRAYIVQNLIPLQRVAYLEGVDAAQKGESRYKYALSP
jgi:hypothetical protein